MGGFLESYCLTDKKKVLLSWYVSFALSHFPSLNEEVKLREAAPIL